MELGSPFWRSSLPRIRRPAAGRRHRHPRRKAGLYFSLNNVSALVTAHPAPRSVKDLRDAILATFDVEREVCERDLEALLRDLASRNLVEIRDAAAA